MNGMIHDREWRDARRQEALEALERLEMPSRVAHRWRFTDPLGLIPGGSLAAAAGGPGNAPLVEVSLPPGARDRGVEVADLALDRQPAFVAEHLGRLSPAAEDPLLALVLGTHRGGIALRVPAGVRLEEPIRIRQQAAAAPGGMVAGRTLVVLEEGAQAEVQEELEILSGHAGWASEAVLAVGARLVHRRLEQVAPGAAAFVRADWVLQGSAFLDHGHGVLSRGLLKSEASVVIRGPGGEVRGNALIVAGDRARADWRVTVEHRAGDTRSRQTVRAAAARKARAAFTGLLEIAPGARGSEAFEEARGLIWDPTATVDLLPELEIRNHDVRCSHGAAVAPLDDEALFYLQSRGLDRQAARRLQLEGFLRGVLEDSPAGEEWLERAWALLADGASGGKA
ncbi:SufD family Fe-S cluster assembly protein [Myxococcota bacterium]|nr:SufD family Fe-S cluster assembly protein [Myxococcota bacterium]